MDRAQIVAIAKGIVLSILYSAIFIVLWRSSVSQWYLPAGIRMAGILFLPRRLWPYLFLGDAIALWTIRAPKAEQYSYAWAYLSPVLLLPLVSLLPIIVRRRAGISWTKESLLPLIMAATAIWTSAVNAGLNYFLSGPQQDISPELFIRFAVGQYLGMLTLTLPVLLWQRRKSTDLRPPGLTRDSLLVGAFLFSALMVATALEGHAIRSGILSVMLLPPIVLTFRHGWRGAVIGMTGAVVAVGLTLPESDAVGAHDAATFVAQEVLAIVGTAMFILGASISTNYNRAAKLRLAELRAKQLARDSQRLAEQDLRDRARALAISQMSIAGGWKEFVGSLKAERQYALAMHATKQSVVNTQMLLDQVSAIYPLGIETEGLYWALRSTAFANACGTEIEHRLTGDPSIMSPEMQVIAYRCIAGAVTALASVDPHKVTVKTSRNGSVAKLAAIVQRRSVSATPSHLYDEDAWLSLDIRIQTNGGAVRRRHDRITFVLSEKAVPQANQFAFGSDSTNQASPSLLRTTNTANSVER